MSEAVWCGLGEATGQGDKKFIESSLREIREGRCLCAPLAAGDPDSVYDVLLSPS